MSDKARFTSSEKLASCYRRPDLFRGPFLPEGFGKRYHALAPGIILCRSGAARARSPAIAARRTREQVGATPCRGRARLKRTPIRPGLHRLQRPLGDRFVVGIPAHRSVAGGSRCGRIAPFPHLAARPESLPCPWGSPIANRTPPDRTPYRTIHDGPSIRRSTGWTAVRNEAFSRSTFATRRRTPRIHCDQRCSFHTSMPAAFGSPICASPASEWSTSSASVSRCIHRFTIGDSSSTTTPMPIVHQPIVA